MGCLSRIAGLVLAVCFFGILWGIPQVMGDVTIDPDTKAFMCILGTVLDLMILGAALLFKCKEMSEEDENQRKLFESIPPPRRR